MSNPTVEVYVHKTKIWVGVPLQPGVYIALWGPSVQNDWRPRQGQPIGTGFKRVQGELIRGDMYKKGNEKERKGYTHVASLPLEQILADGTPPSLLTVPSLHIRNLVLDYAKLEGIDLQSNSGAAGTRFRDHPLASVTELIRGGDSAVPWA